MRRGPARPTSTTFLHDSDRLVAEYNAAGTLLRRYVHGPGVDEPLVWYEGATTSWPQWGRQDRQGSVIAWSSVNGYVDTPRIYKYGPWGEPDDAWAAGASRFRYTGQIAIPEARLYYYKARMYDPATGRFLQTDPIGYKDDLDLYAYVGGDPVNRTDPFGLASCPAGGPCPDVPLPSTEDIAKVTLPRSQYASRENGAVLLRDEQNGSERVKSGDDAGKGSRGEFQFRYTRKKTERAVLYNHLHTRGEGRGLESRRDTASNNGPSELDQAAMQSTGAPQMIQAPDITGVLYRIDKQDRFKIIDGDRSKVPNLQAQDIVIDP